jgi:hypothetical protein
MFMQVATSLLVYNKFDQHIFVTKSMWLIQCFRVSLNRSGTLCCSMGEE